jgi:hypothetical protein
LLTKAIGPVDRTGGGGGGTLPGRVGAPLSHDPSKRPAVTMRPSEEITLEPLPVMGRLQVCVCVGPINVERMEGGHDECRSFRREPGSAKGANRLLLDGTAAHPIMGPFGRSR